MEEGERGCGALRRVLTETKIPARFFQHLSPQIYAQSALMVPVHLPATPSYIVAGRIQQVYEKSSHDVMAYNTDAR